MTKHFGYDSTVGKSLVYISKLSWYFEKYIEGFKAILEAYNISFN